MFLICIYDIYESVSNFLTHGINSLSFVCSIIIPFKRLKFSFTEFIPTISSSLIYPLNLQYNINSSLKNVCNLLVKSSRNSSLFFVNSLFTSCTALYKKCFSING